MTLPIQSIEGSRRGQNWDETKSGNCAQRTICKAVCLNDCIKEKMRMVSDVTGGEKTGVGALKMADKGKSTLRP